MLKLNNYALGWWNPKASDRLSQGHNVWKAGLLCSKLCTMAKVYENYPCFVHQVWPSGICQRLILRQFEELVPSTWEILPSVLVLQPELIQNRHSGREAWISWDLWGWEWALWGQAGAQEDEWTQRWTGASSLLSSKCFTLIRWGGVVL